MSYSHQIRDKRYFQGPHASSAAAVVRHGGREHWGGETAETARADADGKPEGEPQDDTLARGRRHPSLGNGCQVQGGNKTIRYFIHLMEYFFHQLYGDQHDDVKIC